MSIQLFRRAELSTDQIRELDKTMAEFYRHPPSNYYQIAGQAAHQYTIDQQPYHCDLVQKVFPGAAVLEMGCGTAHLCPHVEKRGGHYTGLDYSADLLQDNRQRFPRAQFFELGAPLDKQFDIVTSLYVLEHVTDPRAYLETLWRYCRPGGLIGIICPEFIENPTITPAVFYGKSPQRFREKLLALNLLDAARHLVDLKILGPLWKKNALAAPAGAFWINLQPCAIYTREFFSDADAVHLARLKDIVWFYQQKGAEIIRTSAQMRHVPSEISNFNLYSLVRKPLVEIPKQASA